jgi:hypothetical protein
MQIHRAAVVMVVGFSLSAALAIETDPPDLAAQAPSSTATDADTPQASVGQPAPPLSVEFLDQGERAEALSWASLRGQVVVLEY